MRIGVIGAGQIGGTLIRQYTKAGHQVKMSNSGELEKLSPLALETGASAVGLSEVVTEVDAIVISIPLIATLKLPPDLLKNVSADTAIIDTGNYYPIRDGIIEEIESGMPESIWMSIQLQRSLIKVYNSIFAESLVSSGRPKGAASRLALPVSGDDKKLMDTVSILVNDSGFDFLDCGTLQDSWRQQPGSPAYCTDLTLNQLRKSIIKAKKELLPERRELGLKYIMSHDPALWLEKVKYNRIIYESDLAE
jgi:8-hydroxy-5-deazaflavin:NADPH oxidoreductase